MKKNCFILAAIAILTILETSSSLHAQVLYSDPLTGSGNLDVIQGKTPTTTTGSATWVANSYGPTETTTGLTDGFNGGNFFTETAYLPLTIDGSGIYTLSVTSYVSSASNEGMQLGFIYCTQGTTSGLSTSSAVAYTGINGGQNASGGATSYYGGGNAATTASSFNTANVFTITLDSSTGSLTFAENGTTYETVANALTPLQMASITGVGLGFGYVFDYGTTFSNFSVTEVAATPEPSTWALMVGSFAVLLLVARRKVKSGRVG